MVCDLSNPDLILHFTNNYLDSSGNGNNGINNGTTITSDKNSVPNQAVNFNGSGQFIDIGTFFNPDGSNPFSISLHFNSTTGITKSLISNLNHVAPFTGFDVRLLNTGGIDFFLVNSFSDNAIFLNIVNTGFNDGSYHHIAVTYDGSKTAAGVKIYIDKILQTNSVSFDTLTGNSSSAFNTSIGRRRNLSDQDFLGDMDEVQIFPRVVDQDTIDVLADGYDNPTCVVARNALAFSTNF